MRVLVPTHALLHIITVALIICNNSAHVAFHNTVRQTPLNGYGPVTSPLLEGEGGRSHTRAPTNK